MQGQCGGSVCVGGRVAPVTRGCGASPSKVESVTPSLTSGDAFLMITSTSSVKPHLSQSVDITNRVEMTAEFVRAALGRGKARARNMRGLDVTFVCMVVCPVFLLVCSFRL